MILELVGDNIFIVSEPCGCRGDPECDCWVDDGKRWRTTGSIDLTPLLTCLAVASGLCLSWCLGHEAGGFGLPNDPGTEVPWFPGCGREARP